MNKKVWDLYAPIYERAMRADSKLYEFMYARIPQVIEGKEVLELATGPGLLAKHVAHAAKRMVATDYAEGHDPGGKKGHLSGKPDVRGRGCQGTALQGCFV